MYKMHKHNQPQPHQAIVTVELLEVFLKSIFTKDCYITRLNVFATFLPLYM